MVSAGDLVGASPLLSALFHDEPTIEAMNAIGLDLGAVGNHEFDDGAAELLRLQRGGCHPSDGCQDGTPFGGARFRYLAANVVSRRTGRPLLTPYAIRRLGGVRVGFIGMTLEGTPDIVPPSVPQAFRFIDEAETANRYVRRLRRRGVQAIVVLLHEGGSPRRPALADDCPGLSGPLEDIVRRTSRGGRRLPHRPHARRVQLRDRPPARDQRGLVRPPDHADRADDRPAPQRRRASAGGQLGRGAGRHARAGPHRADRPLRAASPIRCGCA